MPTVGNGLSPVKEARPPNLVGEQHGAGVAPCCQRPTVHHGLNQRVERLELLSHSATTGVKPRRLQRPSWVAPVLKSGVGADRHVPDARARPRRT